MLARLVHFTMDRNPQGGWQYTIGLAWPCGCCWLGTARNPLAAAREAWRAHDTSDIA